MLFIKNKILIALLLALISIEGAAQKKEMSSIWIISFERKVGGREEGVYYWFTRELSDICVLCPVSLPVEDIIRPFGEFPADCLSDVNGYPLSEQVASFSDSSAVYSFLKTVSKHKFLIQKNTHKWKDTRTGHGVEDLSRKKEKIIIYATPVVGVFEIGKRVLLSEDGELIETCSLAPVSDISYDSSLWEKQSVIRYYNFSYIEFTSFSFPISTADNSHIAIARPFMACKCKRK